MEKEMVSVIMATYNCADTVGKSIQSILDQTYTEYELIICDDCSTDGTYEALEEWEKKYPEKIILIRNERNSKLSYSLNHCLKYAKGKYVARMDGDDISEKTRFENQVKFLQDNPQIDLVGTGMKIFDGHRITGVRNYKDYPDKYDLLFRPCFAHATIMTYKKVYDDLGGYTVSKRTERGQDYDLWFRFFGKGFKGANLEEALYIVTEDAACYKRKKYKYRVYATITALKGYKLVGMPPYYYVCALKPLISGLIPKKIKKVFRT